MNVMAMFVPNNQIGLARHGGMHRLTCHLVTQETVVDFCGNTADVIARIEILQGDGILACREVVADCLAEKDADVIRRIYDLY